MSIVDANTLTKQGKRPFHLKVSFEIFDLQGKAADQGTMEYWWAGADGSRVEITSATFGTVHSMGSGGTYSPSAQRSLYLLRELLDDISSPGATLGPANANVVSEERTVGTVRLECMHLAPPPTAANPKLLAGQTTVCADVATGTVRLISASQYEVTRNHLAQFAQTRVPLEVAVFWGGKKAITGHIEQLQSFDPSKPTVTLEKSAATPNQGQSDSPNAHISPGVLAGSRTLGVQPIYPISAKQRRITGTVVLAAEITKEGTIANLIPLASPDPSLTEAATDAVKKWTYKPYLLNGEPTTVDTIITVNFNLN
jgi:TonB family protein